MRRAFSLLETMMSVALLGLVMIFLINLYPSSASAIRVSEQRYRAGTLASSLLAQEMAQPFTAVPVGLSQDFPGRTFEGVTYALHLDVLAVPATSGSGTENQQYLRRLLVTVSWRFRGQTRTVVQELWRHNLPGQG